MTTAAHPTTLHPLSLAPADERTQADERTEANELTEADELVADLIALIDAGLVTVRRQLGGPARYGAGQNLEAADGDATSPTAA